MDSVIARYLREGVDELGISYRELSAQTGISHNRIGIMLRQEPPPATIGEMEQIARALGLTASDLLTRAEHELSQGGSVTDHETGTPDRDEEMPAAPLSLDERRKLAAERAAAAAENDVRLVAQRSDGMPEVHEEGAPPTHDEGADELPDDDHIA